MSMNHPLPVHLPRLLGGAFLSALLAATSLPSAAQTDPGAGRVQLTNSTANNCAYTRITTFPSGGVDVTCTSTVANSATVTVAAPPGSINATTGGSVDLPVTCSGTCSNLVVSLAVNPPNGYAGVSISANSTITFTTPGTVNATVTASAGTAVGLVPISFQITSAGAATGGTTPALNTPTPGPNVTVSTSTTCAIVPNRSDDATPADAGIIYYAIAGTGENYALKFNPTKAAQLSLQFQGLGEAVATGKPSPTATTINIAECPGDFTTSLSPNCGPATTLRGPAFLLNTTTYGTDPAKCLLNPAKQYYMNIRFTTSTGASSCAYGGSGACAIQLSLTYQP
jgi:hypothetical protein